MPCVSLAATDAPGQADQCHDSSPSDRRLATRERDIQSHQAHRRDQPSSEPHPEQAKGRKDQCQKERNILTRGSDNMCQRSPSEVLFGSAGHVGGISKRHALQKRSCVRRQAGIEGIFCASANLGDDTGSCCPAVSLRWLLGVMSCADPRIWTGQKQETKADPNCHGPGSPDHLRSGNDMRAEGRKLGGPNARDLVQIPNGLEPTVSLAPFNNPGCQSGSDSIKRIKVLCLCRVQTHRAG